MSASHPKGRLHLVPTPLDHGCDVQAPITDVLPLGTLQAAARITHWISENAKSTRAFLKRVDAAAPLAQPVQAHTITELPRAVHKKGDHDPARAHPEARTLLAAALQGHDIGLISEAGMPAVADPGSSVVRAAHDLGITVVPLVGPVSILLTLAASGLNGQNFAFIGYLPQEAAARATRIRELEALARKSGQSQLFIETPYRNAALVQALLHELQPGTRLAVCHGLTLEHGRCVSLSVAEWRRAAAAPAPIALPAVFAIGR